LPSRLLNLVKRHRYGCDQIEVDDIANLHERRTQVCDLTAELGNGPPYSAKTTALMRREGYAQDLARLFAAYTANGKDIRGQHEAGMPGVQQVVKKQGLNL